MQILQTKKLPSRKILAAMLCSIEWRQTLGPGSGADLDSSQMLNRMKTEAQTWLLCRARPITEEGTDQKTRYPRRQKVRSPEDVAMPWRRRAFPELLRRRACGITNRRRAKLIRESMKTESPEAVPSLEKHVRQIRRNILGQYFYNILNRNRCYWS